MYMCTHVMIMMHMIVVIMIMIAPLDRESIDLSLEAS